MIEKSFVSDVWTYRRIVAFSTTRAVWSSWKTARLHIFWNLACVPCWWTYQRYLRHYCSIQSHVGSFFNVLYIRHLVLAMDPPSKRRAKPDFEWLQEILWALEGFGSSEMGTAERKDSDGIWSNTPCQWHLPSCSRHRVPVSLTSDVRHRCVVISAD